MCISASSKAAKNSKLETNEMRSTGYHPVSTRLAAVEQEPEVALKICSAPSPATRVECGEEVLVVRQLVSQ